MNDANAVPLDLAPIRARADAATRGPWVRESTDDTDRDIALGYDVPGQGSPNLVATCFDDADDDGRNEDGPITRKQAQANAKFMAAARSDVPALCDEVERLRARLAEVERERDAALCVAFYAGRNLFGLDDAVIFDRLADSCRAWNDSDATGERKRVADGIMAAVISKEADHA